MFKDFQRESFDKSWLIKQTISYLIFLKFFFLFQHQNAMKKEKKIKINSLLT